MCSNLGGVSSCEIMSEGRFGMELHGGGGAVWQRCPPTTASSTPIAVGRWTIDRRHLHFTAWSVSSNFLNTAGWELYLLSGRGMGREFGHDASHRSSHHCLSSSSSSMIGVGRRPSVEIFSILDQIIVPIYFALATVRIDIGWRGPLAEFNLTS